MKKNSNHNYFLELFLNQLRDMYSSETLIIEAMPKLMQMVSSQDLKEALKQHFAETKRQKDRLEVAFTELGEEPEGDLCVSMQGLLKEASTVLKNKSYPSFVEDAAIIAMAQKIEHYEIASYGTLKAFAHHLELTSVEEIINEILTEEKNADKSLSKIAEGSWITSGINAQAVS